MKIFQVVIISFLLLVNFISSASCQDITLSWDPSPTADISGYMVYYKAGNSNLPFNGYEADQGASPIDVGDNLTTTLTGLDDGATYYFSVTAYDYSNNQSAFSNIVNNGTDPVVDPPDINWAPILVTPGDNALTELLPVHFSWDNGGRDNLIYTLYYGTVEDEVTNAGLPLIPKPASFPTNNHLVIISILALLLTIFVRLIAPTINKTKLQTLPLIVVIILGGILTACGGGGGGGGGSSASGVSSTTSAPSTTSTNLYSVETNSEVYFYANDMSSDTTYFWKVIATDTLDTTTTYQSEVREFKTDI